MCFRRFTHLALALLALFGVLGTSARAMAAPTLTLSSVVNRDIRARTDPVSILWISRSDCLLDDVFHFSVTLSEVTSLQQVEVWVGQGSTNCAERTARTSNTAQCLRVYSGPPTPSIQTINIRAQDIVVIESSDPARRYGPNGVNSGTPADCNSTQSAADQLTLYFMLVSSEDAISPVQWQTKVDLLGPPAPADIKLGYGNTLLKVNWKASSELDVGGYTFFCDPPPGTAPGDAAPEAPTSGPICVDASATAASIVRTQDDASDGADATMTPDADASPADATSADATPTADATPGADATPDTGTGTDAGGGDAGVCIEPDGAVLTPNCGGFTFVTGEVPTPDFIARFRCADVAGNTSTEATIRGLTNGVKYAVAVAAFDSVRNNGPLSVVNCKTPQLVNGFDELYHQAGGTAGGGFCSMGHPSKQREATESLGFLLALVALAQRRRSRVLSN